MLATFFAHAPASALVQDRGRWAIGGLWKLKISSRGIPRCRAKAAAKSGCVEYGLAASLGGRTAKNAMMLRMDDWKDCRRTMPYRDWEGRWQFPRYTQRRSINRDGNPPFEYREREPTEDEISGEAW